jgi:hypothetical protein
MCLLIKHAEYSPSLPGEVLGGGIAGSLVGGGLGAIGGGAYKYLTTPDEIDPDTGEQKSKFWDTIKGMGYGGGIGAGIGGIVGAHQNWAANQRFSEDFREKDPVRWGEWINKQPESEVKNLPGYQEHMKNSLKV